MPQGRSTTQVIDILTPQNSLELRMWILPFDVRTFQISGETPPSQTRSVHRHLPSDVHSLPSFVCPLMFTSCRGGLCACHGRQPVGAGRSLPLGSRVPGIKSSSAELPPSMVPSGLCSVEGFAALSLTSFEENAWPKLDTTHTCNEMWHPQRYFHCLRV